MFIAFRIYKKHYIQNLILLFYKLPSFFSVWQISKHIPDSTEKLSAQLPKIVILITEDHGTDFGNIIQSENFPVFVLCVHINYLTLGFWFLFFCINKLNYKVEKFCETHFIWYSPAWGWNELNRRFPICHSSA